MRLAPLVVACLLVGLTPNCGDEFTSDTPSDGDPGGAGGSDSTGGLGGDDWPGTGGRASGGSETGGGEAGVPGTGGSRGGTSSGTGGDSGAAGGDSGGSSGENGTGGATGGNAGSAGMTTGGTGDGGTGGAGSGGTAATGGTGNGGASSGGTGTGGAGAVGNNPSIGSDWAAWPMPNPQAAALPNPSSYTNHGDGTIRDNVTGLEWQLVVPNSTFSHPAAIDYCAALELGGHTDWRLPRIIELASLIDYTRASPAIDPIFTNTPSADFWSATNFATYTDHFFDVQFGDGMIYEWNGEGDMSRVRCVRPPGATGDVTGRYTLVSDGVKDNFTGLIWQQTLPGVGFGFAEAQAHCAMRGAGWRAPSIKEAQTLIDRTKSSRPWDPIFTDAPDSDFWTSSRYALDTAGRAWKLGGNGSAWPVPNEQLFPVRCVK